MGAYIYNFRGANVITNTMKEKDREAVIDLWREGHSLADICETLSLDHSTVNLWINQAKRDDARKNQTVINKGQLKVIRKRKEEEPMSKPPRKTKKVLSLEEKNRLIQLINDGLPLAHAAQKFGIANSTASGILKRHREANKRKVKVKGKPKLVRRKKAEALPPMLSQTADQPGLVDQLRAENAWLRNLLEKWMTGEYTTGRKH